MSKLKAIDFFCGAGGMTYGFRQAGINVIAGIDIDNNCQKTYEKNNQGSVFIQSDISQLTPIQLQKQLKIKRNDDNLVFIGCSPCQYWSIINTDKTKARKSKSLLKNFQQFVDYFMPGYIAIENVPGILNKKNETVLSEFLAFLYGKYEVKSAIVNMNNYGVPQKRKRFSLIASRISKDISLLLPTCSEEKPTVKQTIGIKNGFCKIPAGYKDNSLFLHSTMKLSEKNIERLKKTPKDGGNRLAWKDIPELQLKAYIGKDNYFSDVYGRMSWNAPAPTITTKFFSLSNGRFGHPEENRSLSIREGAALQTFPNDYQFLAGTLQKNATLIGNAVPPEFAKRIGIALIQHHKKYGK